MSEPLDMGLYFTIVLKIKMCHVRRRGYSQNYRIISTSNLAGTLPQILLSDVSRFGECKPWMVILLTIQQLVGVFNSEHIYECIMTRHTCVLVSCVFYFGRLIWFFCQSWALFRCPNVAECPVHITQHHTLTACWLVRNQLLGWFSFCVNVCYICIGQSAVNCAAGLLGATYMLRWKDTIELHEVPAWDIVQNDIHHIHLIHNQYIIEAGGFQIGKHFKHVKGEF